MANSVNGTSGDVNDDFTVPTLYLDNKSTDKDMNPNQSICDHEISVLGTSEMITKICTEIEQEIRDDQNDKEEIIVNDLNDALEDLLNVQSKCMDFLSHASDTFPANGLVLFMCEKFKNLNKNAINFAIELMSDNAQRGDEVYKMFGSYYTHLSADNANGSGHSSLSQVMQWLNSDVTIANEKVFKWNDIECLRIDLQSLNHGELVMSSVIDAWCCLLNLMNSRRPQSYPNRVFCFTETTIGVVNSRLSTDPERFYDVFSENIKHVLNLFSASLEDIDMMFFPMIYANHHFVVCYNLKEPALEILDNICPDKDLNFFADQQIDLLHILYKTFLYREKFKKSSEIELLIPKRLETSWQTKYNSIDCGIFAIQHMHTYVGGGAENWKTIFVEESFDQMKQLDHLRDVFATQLVTSNFNELRDVIYQQMGGNN